MRKILLVAVIVALTVFCAFNLQYTTVWPLRTQLPLFVIVLAAFAVGLATGWAGHAVNAARRRRVPQVEGVPEAKAKTAGPAA